MAALAVALTVAGLSTLGSGQSANDERLNLIHSAPDVALQSQRFQMEMSISLAAQQGPTHTATQSAVLDAAHGRASLLLADVMSPRPGGWRLVSQDKTLYLLLGRSGATRYPGKIWVAVDLHSSAAAQGAAVGPIPDPLSFLAGLRGVEGVVRRLTGASVDGIRATAYAAVINLDAMSKAVGPEGLSQVQALQRLGGPDLPATVWLDDKGRPRQIDVRADLGQQGTILTQVKFEAFGEPVTVGIPNEDVVVHVPTLSEALTLAGIPSN
jgi:hypothetical protein